MEAFAPGAFGTAPWAGFLATDGDLAPYGADDGPGVRSAAGDRARWWFWVLLLAVLAINAAKSPVIIARFEQWDVPAEDFLLRFSISFAWRLALLPLLIRLSAPLLLLVAVLQSLFHMVHTLYFAFFRIPLTWQAAVALAEEGWTLLRLPRVIPWDAGAAIAIADLPLVVGLLLLRQACPQAWPTPGRTARGLGLGGVIILTAALSGLIWLHGSPATWFRSPAVTDHQAVRWCGLPGYMLGRLVWGEPFPRLTYASTIVTGPGRHPPYDIVLIQVESLDSGLIGRRSRDGWLLPHLTALAREGVFFPVTLAYHLGGATTDCEISILNSVEPLVDQPAIKSDRETFPNSMVAILAEQGYSTQAFHGNLGEYFNRRQAFPRMGFQRFHDVHDMQLWGEPDCWGAADELVFAAVARTWASTPAPRFFHVITMTSHSPFDAVNKYPSTYAQAIPADLLQEVEPESVRNYFRSMVYVDACIGSFVASLDRRSTVIAIFGDHSFPLESTDYRSHRVLRDGRLFEFVPLILLVPGATPRVERTMAAGFLDIAPTLLRAAGVPFRLRSAGSDLLDPAAMARSAIPFLGSECSRKDLVRWALEHAAVPGCAL
ncbi:MAG: Lipoteichoic acid synthase LtaS Type IVb [Candidatus Ozemobacter sibiricus]|uniref:Lipoteichoic acid synthase LtaS Type IVb n=1 Tax=Candidatus Ozemobacter sibiricus TaxID=2268124 RepID=A0A367ZRN4_9BACT|nr:MAG: Lipoteichoic acid synthase LtaS Type IVb [Candidatus Ozemobacter sibiricus]